MNTLIQRLKRRVADEAGAALVVVLALSITMLILITAALSFSLSGVKTAYVDVDNSAALAAAYAGIDEYSSRLSNDSTYYQFGNKLSPFTKATNSDSTVALPPPGKENAAFGVGKGGSWATIEGTDGRVTFRYEVDNSRYSGTGSLRVRSTGRVGNQTASVVADLKQSGFIDYLYFSDHEIRDPELSNTDCGDSNKRPSDWVAVKTGQTYGNWHGSSCTEIQFGEDDVLNGKVHSNDIIKVCGSTFTKLVTSSSPITSPQYRKGSSGCANGSFSDLKNTGGAIPRVARIEMPKTNDGMKNEARLDLPEITRPGCLYTGPTSITFLANGKINVVSPWTKFTRPNLTNPSLSQNPVAGVDGIVKGCGVLSELHSPDGSTFFPPEQNLIFVQNVPNADTDPAAVNDPNYGELESTIAGYYTGPWYNRVWHPAVTVGANPTGFTCNNRGNVSEGWILQKSGSTTIQYPLSNEATPNGGKDGAPASYGCTNGDVYVKGTVNGQITVASENYVYVTANVEYNVKDESSSDVLGLVGNNAVWVWNPMRKSGSNYYPLTGNNRTISAAIMSVRHTFQVQNYSVGGERGRLTINGAIAQKFRGTVASGSNGYDKTYNYDVRLFAISPPKFLTPISTTYGVTKYALVRTGFNADGVELDANGNPVP